VTTESQRNVWGDVIFLVDLMEDGPVKTKWTAIINKLLLPFATLDYEDPAVAGYFSSMVTDQLQVSDGVGGTRDITSQDVTERSTRQGSWAEVECGSNVILSQKDISDALNP
jgi:hypothetical protein